MVAGVLIVLPACDRNTNVNQTDGIRDAIGDRPHEDDRDAADDAHDVAGDVVKQFGQDITDEVSVS